MSINVVKEIRDAKGITARRWNLSSSIIFTLGSFTSAISAVATVYSDSSLNNVGQMIGYLVYSFAYSVYLYAEFKNNKNHYVFSTVAFLIASLVFVIFCVYDTYDRKDYSLTNLSTLVGNWSWLIGYLCSYKGELLTPAKTGLDQLSIPIMHHNNNNP